MGIKRYELSGRAGGVAFTSIAPTDISNPNMGSGTARPHLIGAGIRQSRPDRYRREFAHRIYPHTLRHQNVGQANLFPHFPPHFASAAHGRQRTRAEDRRHNRLGFLGFLGTSTEVPGRKNGGRACIERENSRF
jgi:hypothetical protein